MALMTIDPPVLSTEQLARVDTPALIVDLDRMDAAIALMASSMADRGVALRPHAKTHKSIEVGRRQVEASASGLTVGTIGEAEVFADAGLDDLFIAYPAGRRRTEGRAAPRIGGALEAPRRHRLGCWELARSPRRWARIGAAYRSSSRSTPAADEPAWRRRTRATWHAPRSTSAST